jgi:hypothetical protein
MPDPDNIVLEHLRHIHDAIDDMRDDLRDVERIERGLALTDAERRGRPDLSAGGIA